MPGKNQQNLPEGIDIVSPIKFIMLPVEVIRLFHFCSYRCGDLFVQKKINVTKICPFLASFCYFLAIFLFSITYVKQLWVAISLVISSFMGY